MVNKFSEKKAGIALEITGLVVGTTVFFEAGVVILIPLAFGLAKKTKKSTLYYVIPLLAGLATGFAFIPPSAGSVLVPKEQSKEDRTGFTTGAFHYIKFYY